MNIFLSRDIKKIMMVYIREGNILSTTLDGATLDGATLWGYEILLRNKIQVLK